jgi:hypothetical protein
MCRASSSGTRPIAKTPHVNVLGLNELMIGEDPTLELDFDDEASKGRCVAHEGD